MYIKKIMQIIIFLLAPLVIYTVLSFILLLFPSSNLCKKGTKTVYIYADMAHTEIIVPVNYFSDDYKNSFPNLLKNQNYGFLAFSYGDEEFFMNVPTWEDINYKIALKSLFLNTPALVRVGHYGGINKELCVKVELSDNCLEKLNQSIFDSFKTKDKHFIRYNDHYKNRKVFYFQAKKSYNLFYTCNSWSSEKLRDAGIKTSYLTPFAYQVVYPLKD